jgi:hypothetical protein
MGRNDSAQATRRLNFLSKSSLSSEGKKKIVENRSNEGQIDNEQATERLRQDTFFYLMQPILGSSDVQSVSQWQLSSW